MAHNFGSLVFTPAVKALQERYGSRRQYARIEGSGVSSDRLGPEESSFIAERDAFYMASIGATGWPYFQHRGGPKGFLKVIDERTLAFADFRGNKQFVSTGNLTTDNRVALILVDYPQQARLKILGRAEIFEGEQARELSAAHNASFHGGTDSGSACAFRTQDARSGTGKQEASRGIGSIGRRTR